MTFDERLQARRILLPQRLPQRNRLVDRLRLAFVFRLRFAGVAARELRMQMTDLFAQDFRDSRPLARRKLRDRERVELADEHVVRLADRHHRQRLRPLVRTLRIGKAQARRHSGDLARLRLRGRFVVLDRRVAGHCERLSSSRDASLAASADANPAGNSCGPGSRWRTPQNGSGKCESETNRGTTCQCRCGT